MKKLFLLLALAAGWSTLARAQSTYIGPPLPLFNTIRNGTGAPSPLIGNNGDFYIDTTAGAQQVYGPKYNGVWGAGTSIVAGATGCGVASASLLGCIFVPLNSGLSVDSSGHLTVSLAAAQMPAFTGDITTTAGSLATTLATVNSTPGTFGSSTQSVVLTVDGKGRITAINQVLSAAGGGSGSGLPDPGANGVVERTAANTTTAVAAPTGAIVGTTDTQTLTNKSIAASEINSGTLPTAQMPAFSGDVSTSAGSATTTLATVNSSPGTFGSSTQSVVLTVDGKGRITAVSQAGISGGGGGIASGTLASIPTTCTAGTLYFATDQPAGQQIYTCSATNTWTLEVSLGGSGALAFTGGSLDIVTSVVPRLAGANAFTGLNSFASGVQLGTTALGQPSCSASLRGLEWFNNTGTAGATPDNFQLCEWNGTTYSWFTPGSGGGGGTGGLPDPGANGLVVRTAPGTTAAVAAPSGTVVGTTDTQTLTNKSIDPSEVTGPGNLLLGSTVVQPSGTASPYTVSLGSTYSNTPGANLKFKLFDAFGQPASGLGIESTAMDLVVGGAASFKFWANGVNIGTLDPSGNATFNSINAGALPAFTGDVTKPLGSTVLTLPTVDTTPGSFGDATHIPQLTVNGKGQVTASAQVASQVPASAIASDSLLSLSGGTLMADRSDPALGQFNANLNNFVLATNLVPSKAVNVALIGDSWTEGGGAFSAYSNVWAQQLQRDLQTTFGYHGSGLVPIHTSAGSWVLTGTWTQISALGPTQSGASAFNMLYVASGATNTAAFGTTTPNVIKYYGDHLIVYYATYTDSGSGFGVAIDGGSTTTCGAATTGSYTPATCTITSSAGWHTVVITPPASGNCYLYGAEWTSGSTGVSVHNMGRGGARAEAFGSATATQLAWLPQIAGGLHLAIISLGVNDYGNNIAPATYQTYLQAIITNLQALASPPSILILDQGNTNTTCGGTCTYTQSQYRAIEQALAISNNAAYLSVGERWGTYANANTILGVMATDGIHPNDSGYLDIAKMIERRLIEKPNANGLVITPGGNLGLGNPAHNFGVETGSLMLGPFTGGTGAFNAAGFDTYVGYQAGNAETTGAHNTCVGRFSCGSGPTTGSFDSALGDGASTGASTQNAVQLAGGTNSVTNTAQYGSWNFLDTSGNFNANLTREAVGTAIAAAATIAPVAPITHITNNAVAIATITVPTVAVAGGTFKGCIKLISDNGFATTTGGNIASPAVTTTAGTLHLACYEGTSWYMQ